MNHVQFLSIGVLAGWHADDAPRNTGPDFGKASPFGLLVIVLLLLGTFFLVWSMNRQLKKVPKSFDRKTPGSDRTVDNGTADVEADKASEHNGGAHQDSAADEHEGSPHEPDV